VNRAASTIAIAALLLASCGGGGGTAGGDTSAPQPQIPQTPTAVFQTPTQESLSVADIQRIIAQGVAEATAQNQPSGFVVIDRVGNVLAVFTMNGANLTLRTPPAPNGQSTDLQNLNLPAPAALAGGISKALTSSYFSSMGAAFSSRTANDIVQETFPNSATTRGLESGPLFSVQFSQLPCSDVSSRFPNRAGSHRGPLGVGADPGAFPLYKNGVVVGSVAVVGDGVYGFDTEYTDNDRNAEEVIALAATTGFEPRAEIRANRISVDGTLLRYSDATTGDFRSNPANAPGFATINGVAGNLVSVNGYYNAGGGILPGTAYGSEASGVRPATPAEFNVPEAWVLSDGLGNQRYPIRAGTDAASVPTPLSAAEVRTLLTEAFLVQRAARAQLRYPLDNRAQNTIVVVDTNGEILGLVRGPDALVDAIDAVPQKARTTVFFSSPFAAGDLLANPDPQVGAYVSAFRNFVRDPAALTGNTAFSLRAIGNLARPWFPDGELGRPPGPLSIPFERFNIFSTGLQSRLITNDILTHVGFIFGANPDVPQSCTRSPIVPATGGNRIRNGLTVFAGGVPIYRGGRLVGAIASSGDGNDQSDMIAFLGLYNTSQQPGATIGHADPSIRSDRIDIPVGPTSTRLRYVLCPFNPFVGTNEQNVCQGK
jgi:uncharacterized protein GlcG (DUF336 family)